VKSQASRGQDSHCGQIQKRSVAAALHLWISLPEDLQAKLISQELGENDFISLVRQIVDERIKLSRQAVSKNIRKKKAKKSHAKGLNAAAAINQYLTQKKKSKRQI